ncbi:hypothetical protein DSUL_100013 [Desulfovibrionales bacterium]
MIFFAMAVISLESRIRLLRDFFVPVAVFRFYRDFLSHGVASRD